MTGLGASIEHNRKSSCNWHEIQNPENWSQCYFCKFDKNEINALNWMYFLNWTEFSGKRKETKIKLNEERLNWFFLKWQNVSIITLYYLILSYSCLSKLYQLDKYVRANPYFIFTFTFLKITENIRNQN